MTASADDVNVTWATPGHGRCATHRQYRLSCEQFDELLERSGNCCEICGIEAAATPWGPLHIDHDSSKGKWAVRGLLCEGCNIRLRADRRIPRTPQIEQYLLNPWYLQALERLGRSAERWPEPGLGSTVSASGYTWMRTSATKSQWEGRPRNSPSRKSWTQLWYDYGPFNIGHLQVRTSIPDWAYRSLEFSFIYRREPRDREPTRDILSARISDALAVARTAKWQGAACKHLDDIIRILAAGQSEAEATANAAD